MNLDDKNKYVAKIIEFVSSLTPQARTEMGKKLGSENIYGETFAINQSKIKIEDSPYLKDKGIDKINSIDFTDGFIFTEKEDGFDLEIEATTYPFEVFVENGTGIMIGMHGEKASITFPDFSLCFEHDLLFADLEDKDGVMDFIKLVEEKHAEKNFLNKRQAEEYAEMVAFEEARDMVSLGKLKSKMKKGDFSLYQMIKLRRELYQFANVMDDEIRNN